MTIASTPTWRWFVCVYPSGPRLFRLATDGSAVQRAADTGWVEVPGAMERLLTDPDYREVDEREVMALAPPSPNGAPEQRTKFGLKEGGGGHQQVYAAHGKYGTAFDLAVARVEAAKAADETERLAPVSGQTVKGTVNLDLTMSALPEAVQAKAMAQMEQTLGVDYETGVEHLVKMAEAADARPGDELPGENWYSDARTAALTSAGKYGIHPDVGMAVVAAMSPGTKWEENIRNADAVMSVHSQWDKPLDPAHIRNVNEWANRPDKTTGKRNSEFRAEAGETLAQLYAKDPHLAAVYVAKETHASVGRSYDNFFKGLDLVAANDPKVIDPILKGPKVRSFYNNIANPLSGAGDVTIDIHMQRAIANDLTSTTPEQKHEHMASIAKRSSLLTGSPSYAGAALGAMPAMADVTREATRRYNTRHSTRILPSQFQAIVWTEQISQFTPQKVEAILKAPVPEIPTVPAP